MEQHTDPITNTIEEWHPMLLSTIANAMDNPTYHQAMNGPDRDGYQEAMDIEIETLLGKDSWEVVDRTDEMNVLDSTWAFKCKTISRWKYTKTQSKILCSRRSTN